MKYLLSSLKILPLKFVAELMDHPVYGQVLSPMGHILSVVIQLLLSPNVIQGVHPGDKKNISHIVVINYEENNSHI